MRRIEASIRRVEPLAIVAVVLACANVLILLPLKSYDFRVGSLHAVAHGNFKPLQFVAGIFFVTAILRCRPSTLRFGSWELRRSSFWLMAVSLFATALLLYWPSLEVNFNHPEWNHRGVSAALTSVSSLVDLFAKRQVDGFYRPLGFVSLWADYQMFGTTAAGYHFQSILLHGVDSVLVLLVAQAAGFERAVGEFGALLFATAPVAFEAVLWPAARFDLLATAFVLVAVVSALRYVGSSDSSSGWAFAMASAYVLALLSKESAYCFPFIAAALFLARWKELPKNKVLFAGMVIASATVVMIGVRLIIYDGLGGYAIPAGVPHFHFGWRTLSTLVTRVFGVSPFCINTTVAQPLWMKVAVGGYILAIASISLGGFRLRGGLLLILLALLTAVPAANIIGWVGASAQHSRYLYLPSVWLMLLFASILAGSRRPRLLLSAMAVVYAVATSYNVWVYRDMLMRADRSAEIVAQTVRARSGITEVRLVSLPPEPNGVLFFATELKKRIEDRLPGTTVLISDHDQTSVHESPCAIFRWISSERLLATMPEESH